MSKNVKNLKKELFTACLEFVNQQEETVSRIIRSNQNGLTTETKSSAGDKHETGRAMLQLEIEKASQQLAGINEMKIVLSKINIDDTSKTVKLGSIILTDQVNYFLSISAGQINISNKIYYAISSSSPIGKLILGKSTGDVFIFRKPIIIQEVF